MFYLIDFENISSAGLKGIELLTQEDTVAIFYSKNADKVSMDIHIKLENSLVKKEYIEVETSTKNALDFQLVTYLGSLIAQNPDNEYAIVSKDEGFKAVIEFWKNRGKTVEIYLDLNKKVKPLPIQPIESESIEKILAQHPDKVDTVTEIVGKYKTKVGVNNALVKAYNTEIAGNIYKAIKPLLKDKK